MRIERCRYPRSRADLDSVPSSPWLRLFSCLGAHLIGGARYALTLEMSERLAELSRAIRASTLKRLHRVPPGRENWRLSPNALSFADIAQHLIDADEWLFRKLDDPGLEPMVARSGSAVIADRQEYESIIVGLVTSGERRAGMIAELSEDDLARRMFDGRFGAGVSVWWIVVRGNLDHESHHRGQLAAYLRALENEAL